MGTVIEEKATEVILTEGGIASKSVRIVPVLRVTRTQVVLAGSRGERRFDRNSGYERGWDGYAIPRIEAMSEEGRERARVSTAREKLGRLAFQVEQALNGDELRKHPRGAAELESCVANLEAALQVLKS